jgi:hypothetical protein
LSSWRGISAGATTGGSRRRRAAAMRCHSALQPMRRLKVASAHAGILVMQGGRLDSGNSTSIATRAGGEEGPVHQCRQRGNRRQAGLTCGNGRGHCRSSPTRRKTTREAFPFFEIPFPFKFLGTSEKCEILRRGRLEYLGQLLYWSL